MYYIVLMRNSSDGPIHQNQFETLTQATAFFDVVKNSYTFVKLCEVIKDNS